MTPAAIVEAERDSRPAPGAGADSSNRPWETDSLRIGPGGAALGWGYLAIAGAALVSLADVALLGGHHGAAELLAGAPRGRLLAGHGIGVLALLLYLPGYWLVYRGLQPAGWVARAVLLLGASAAALGGVRHAALGLTAALAGDAAAAPLPFGRPLAAIVFGLFALASIGIALGVGSGRSALPRWLAAATPLAVGVVLLLPYLVAPELPAARLLAAAAPDLGHLVFFALLVAGLGRPPGAARQA